MPFPWSGRARLLLAPAVVMALAFAIACGGGKKPDPAAAPAASAGPVGPCGAVAGAATPQGGLLITRDQALTVRDMKSGKETKLLTAPPGQFITFPAWSPDGKRFVYMVDAPFQGNVGSNWGADMCIADANGGNQQVVLKHDQPGVELESPSWTPDGKTIVFSYFLTQYDEKGQYKGQVYQAQKLDLATGGAASFMDNANGTDLCADGHSLAYVDFDQTNFDSYGVWVADADGKNGKSVVDSSTGMQAFYAPIFSPDCKQIIFAAVGGSLRQPAAPGTRGNPLARLVDALRPASAEAHGPPWDLWSVNVDGSDLKRLTHVNEDLPYTAWSADGKTVLFLGAGGLYQMQPDGSSLKKIDQGTTHGQISWHP
jgi:Tol biopolymer transport system component